LEDKDSENIYAIPANYTDSGKILGGMLEARNAAETIILLIAVGYPELILIPMPGTVRIVVMTITLLPLSVLSLMGIDGDSLFMYIGHMIRYFIYKRRLHFRRVGYKYDPAQLGRKAVDKKKKARKA
jgi:hypothetical protein